MATLLLVRHGVTLSTGKRAGGRTDASLTDEGQAQAAAIADRLARRSVTAVYTSPIVRAVETARPIADRHDLEIVPTDGVQELDHGRWTDRPLKQMARTNLFEWVVRTPSRTSLPDGESFVSAQGRAVSAIEEIVAGLRDRATIVVTSHADIIKLITAHYVGMPLDAFQRLIIQPASLTTLLLPKHGDARLVGFNDVSHLAGLS
jgi:broad specificity phosphatase PhoE